MGLASSYTHVLFCRVSACLLAGGMIAGAYAAEKPKEKPSAAHPGTHFSNGRPKLRPLFGSVHEHGVEPNKFNDGGEITVQDSPPKAPKKAPESRGFNPDPGGVTPDPKWDWQAPGTPAVNDPLSDTTAGAYGSLFPESNYPQGEAEPFLPDSLMLPRRNVEGTTPVRRTFHVPEYYETSGGYRQFNNSEAMPNRWEISVPHWQRYMDPANETPYQYDTPNWWHPYKQSRLKGDVPVFGTQDIFMNVTVKNFSLFEKRKLPTPSGVSAAQAGSSEFFGRSESILASNDTSIAVDLFSGETAFKPVHWMLRVLGVYNTNWIRFKENNNIDPDPRGTVFDGNDDSPNTGKIEAYGSTKDYGPDTKPEFFNTNVSPANVFNYIHDQLEPTGDAASLVEVDDNNYPKNGKDGKPGKGSKDKNGTRYTTRQRDFFALQEAFAEFHISDLTDNYDFISSRWGIQPFVSDFRGFVFADTNLGARIFGNYDNGRLQYNVAYFNMREKDTYSDLNMFDSRHQQVFVANLYKQDFLFKGYTAQLSFLANYDDGGTHYQKDGFLTRPGIIGTVPEEEGSFLGTDGSIYSHKVRSYYLGWNGDGHIGRLNLTHSFYYVFGEDEMNGLAGRKVDISAAMGAAELSYDRDWIRVKLSAFYATGDSKPLDQKATGFDSIVDNPFFIGGPFSWYVHQGFNLAGTGVNLKQRDSLVPNLRTSKNEGQSNFVNPGVTIIGFGTDFDVTPKLRAFANANYIWFNDTDPLRLALQTNKVRNELGLDLSVGFKYRPFLTEQVVISAGIGALFPGAGYRDIYRRNTIHVPGYGPQDEEGKVDRYLYNAFMTLTLVY